jgi:hypothetical protein
MKYKIIKNKELLETGEINIISTKIYAEDRGVEIYEDVSIMTSEQIQKAFEIAKNVNIERLRKQTQEALKMGFEYPANSGNYICLDNNSALQIQGWYNLIKQRINAQLQAFPVFYVGAGFKDLNFQNESDIDNFFNEAFTAFNQLNTINFKAGYDAINAIVMVDDNIIEAIEQLEAINYIKL